MNKKIIYDFLNYFFALVWFINGFFCKILNLEPRHQQIVGKVLMTQNQHFFTLIIGILELLMVFWILIKLFPKLNAVVQITIVLTMNFIEFFFVQDLLLWGKFNIVFALFFVALIFYKEFILKKEIKNVSIS